MTITYNLLGPGYNDASLGYNGDEIAPVSGDATGTITDPNALTSTASDETHTATVTVE